MEPHLRTLGVLYLLSGAVYLLGAVLLATALTGAGLAFQDWGVFALLSGLGVALALFLAVLGLPGLLAGAGLLGHRWWARPLALVLGVLNLVNFPLGTLMGGYTVWVLSQPGAERLLARGRE